MRNSMPPGTMETSVAQVGLRDLLFYVLPGAVLLIAVCGLTGTAPEDILKYGGIAPSIAGLLSAYTLGQCAYPLSYLTRFAWEGFQSQKKRNATFRDAYRSQADDAPTYFAVEIFRYRTLARFCSAMVLPLLVATASAIFGKWQLSVGCRCSIGFVGALAVVGFLHRYTTPTRTFNFQDF